MASALIHCKDGSGLAHRVAQAVGTSKFNLWFTNARIALEGTALRVGVPNRFIADWIQNHFQDQLLKVAQKELGPAAAVKVAVEAADSAATPPSAVAVRAVQAPAEAVVDEPATTPGTRGVPAIAGRRGSSGDGGGRAVASGAAPMPQNSRSSSPQSISRASALRYDLSDFAVGASNDLAYNAAVRLVDENDSSMSPLFIHGSCGLGKTHLLQGLCRRFAAAQPTAPWRYTTAEQFTNDYVQAVRFNKLNEFRRKLRQLDLLVVDDVHFFANKSATQTEFLHTFNAIDLQGAKLVLASDAHPKTIKELADALVSRFLSGMVVQVQTPDRQTRVRIIETLARRRSLTLLEGVAATLADNCTGSVREIEGMLTRLTALAALERRPGETAGPVGQALLQRLIGAVAPTITRRPVRLDHILAAVCETLHVERSAVMTRSRHKRVVLARSVTIYLARQLTTLSYPELAMALCRPNHSTIVTAAQRVEGQLRRREAIDPVEGLNVSTIDQLIDLLRRRTHESSAMPPKAA